MRRDAVYAPSGAAEDLDFEDDVVFPPDLVDALNGNVRISKRVYSGDPRRWAAKPIHPAGYKDHVLWLPASIWEGYVKNDEVLSQLSYDEGTIMLKCQVIDKIGSTYTLKCLYDNEDEDDFEASMCATFTVGKPGQSYSSSKKRKASSKAPAAANGATGEGGADDTVGEEEGGDSDEEEEEYRDLSDNEEAYGGRPEYQAEEEEEEEHQVQEQDGLTHDGGVWDQKDPWEFEPLQGRGQGFFPPAFSHDVPEPSGTSRLDWFLFFFPTALWAIIVGTMNKYLTDKRQRLEKHHKRTGDITYCANTDKKEIIKFFGLIILIGYGSGASYRDEWMNPRVGIWQPLALNQYMPRPRFDTLLESFAVAPYEENPVDEWYEFRPLVTHFNEHMTTIFQPGWSVCVDESMFSWMGQGLPHFSVVARKPKGKGTEVKTAACGILGIIFAMEVAEKAADMKLKEYFAEYGATTSCTLRLVKSLFQTRPRVVIGDSWFASVKTCQALWEKGHLFFVGCVKTAHKNFPKKFLLGKVDEARGSWTHVSATIGGVAMLALAWRRAGGKRKGATKILGEPSLFISSCATTMAGSKAKFKRHHKPGKRAQRKADREIERPLVAEWYYSIMPMIDRHNARRQHSLALGECWTTHDPFHKFFGCWLGVIIINAYLACMYTHKKSKGLFMRSGPNGKEETQRLWVERLAMEMVGWDDPLKPQKAAAQDTTAKRDRCKQKAFDALEVPAGGKTKRPQRCVACSDNSASIFCVTCCEACTTPRDPSDFAFCNSKHKECWSKHVWETCKFLHASNTPTAPVSPPAKKRRASTGSMTGPSTST